MSAGETVSSLRRGVGSRSRAAGFSFAVLTVVLLLLSLQVESIVLQVDSVVSFLVAVILLFADPRKRVRPPVLTAILQTPNEAVSTPPKTAALSYDYVASGDKPSDVLVRAEESVGGPPIGNAASEGVFTVVPPGRGLAELFIRETGRNEVTLETLKASLSQVMGEAFGLADSARMDFKDDHAVVVLENPSVWCNCDALPQRQGGYKGCAVASSLAVLFCLATKREVRLERCAHDLGAGTWKIAMSCHSLHRVLGR